MKPITIDPVEDVGHLCNLLRPKNVLALTTVTVAESSNNGSGLKMVTIPSPTLYIDPQQRTVLIQQGQCFGPDTTILGYSLILFDPDGSRVYHEEWYRNGAGILESSRKFASSDVVKTLPLKSKQILVWRSWLHNLFTSDTLSTLYADRKLPRWIAFGTIPDELASEVTNSEHRQWFRRARWRANRGLVK